MPSVVRRASARSFSSAISRCRSARFSGTLSDSRHLAVRGRGDVLRRAFPPHDANACGALRVLRLPWSPAVSGRGRPRARPGARAGHRGGGGDGREGTGEGAAMAGSAPLWVERLAREIGALGQAESGTPERALDRMSVAAARAVPGCSAALVVIWRDVGPGGEGGDGVAGRHVVVDYG